MNFPKFLALVSIGITFLSYFIPGLFHFAAGAFRYEWGGWEQIAGEITLYQFLHGWLIHLLSNVFFLVYFSGVFSSILKEREQVIFFLLNTVIAYFSLITFSNGITVGISGFCMAMLAYIAMWMRTVRHTEANAAFFMLALNIAIGFVGNISLVGHATGALFWIAYFYLRRKVLTYNR